MTAFRPPLILPELFASDAAGTFCPSLFDSVFDRTGPLGAGPVANEARLFLFSRSAYWALPFLEPSLPLTILTSIVSRAFSVLFGRLGVW